MVTHQRSLYDEARRQEDLARKLQWAAWLMDRAVTIPGTRISVGLDALLGVLPVGGDLLTGLVQAGLVLVALKHYRVPRVVAIQMAANVLIDIAIGAVPVLGDLFDVAFKANTRNLRLLEPYLQSPGGGTGRYGEPLEAKRSGTPLRYVLPIALVLVFVLVLVLIGFVTLVRWVVNGLQ